MTNKKPNHDNVSHKEKMQELKSNVDEKIRSARDKKGLLIVNTGHGKGKSTAAFGTVARAVGHGKKAAVVQFIKGQWTCGERDLLQTHGVEFIVMGTGFTWNTQDKDADKKAAEEVWKKTLSWLQTAALDLLVLDELTYMINFGYLDLESVIKAIKERPPMQHLIITGRDCPKKLMDLADTVSEINSIKHAFDAGIKAQKGIDY
ncbi:MAG: cob(I)yrinic acid a,c-diamide adenosyltransferase [Pseudomonadota bacterium]